MKLFGIFILAISMAAASSSILEAELIQKIQSRSQSPLTVIVTFGESKLASSRKLQMDAMTFSDRSARISAVSQVMQETAQESQQDAMTFLNEVKAQNDNMEVETIWLTNQAIVKNAPPTIFEKLGSMANIEKIELEKFIKIRPIESNDVLAIEKQSSESKVPYGIRKIEADKVKWQGEGVRVGIIDTGVLPNHEALRDNFVGKWGWYDPQKKTAEPNDSEGHGTHCAGTILGRTRNIGVAPKAKWMGCIGCAGSSCSSSDLLKCCQFMACPTDTNDKEKNCSMAPHVVSNSWGGFSLPGGNSDYNNVIAKWQQLGIIPVFAIGNSYACGGAGSPGDNSDVIGVGSIGEDGKTSGFSSRGPSKTAKIKPDITAPGDKILSASHDKSGTQYKEMSGTSMATPHVAGVVAILISSQGGRPVSYKNIYDAITQSAVATNDTMEPFILPCGASIRSRPNNHVGYGLINVPGAIAKLRELMP